MKLELKVKKIQKKVIDNEEMDNAISYTMTLGTSSGSTKITLIRDEPFNGFRPKQSILVELTNPQKSLNETDDGSLANKESEKESMVEDLSKDKKKKKKGGKKK